MLDFWLAFFHHIVVFALFAIVAMELSLLKQRVDAALVRRLTTIDAIYGGLAVVILLVGFARATLAAKGWFYYSHNLFFWLKIATFALIGLLSVFPTLTFLRWRRQLKLERPLIPEEREVRRLRLLLHIEATLFVPLLAFAVAMARGYGVFNP